MSPALLTGALLFVIGFFGIIARRNLIIILMSVELMLNGVNITLMAFSRMHPHSAASSQLLVMLVFAVAACEAAVGLSIIVSLFRQTNSIDADQLLEAPRYRAE